MWYNRTEEVQTNDHFGVLWWSHEVHSQQGLAGKRYIGYIVIHMELELVYLVSRLTTV